VPSKEFPMAGVADRLGRELRPSRRGCDGAAIRSPAEDRRREGLPAAVDIREADLLRSAAPIPDGGEDFARTVGRIDRSVERSPCARRSDRPRHPPTLAVFYLNHRVAPRPDRAIGSVPSVSPEVDTLNATTPRRGYAPRVGRSPAGAPGWPAHAV